MTYILVLTEVYFREIERRLNRCNSGPSIISINTIQSGFLLCDIHAIYQHIDKIPQEYQANFKEDLEDLCQWKMTVSQRLETVKRMYRNYHFLTKQ